MKLPWDKKYLCWAVTAFAVIAASIAFYMLIDRWGIVKGATAFIIRSLRPITYGLIMAYLLNSPMNVLEKMFFKVNKKIFKKNHVRANAVSRAFAIAAVWAIVIAIISALVNLVVPELYNSMESLVMSLPEYANITIGWASEFLRKNPEVLKFLQDSVKNFTTDISVISERLKELLPNINVLITGLSNGVFGTLKAMLNLIIGIIVSVYVLKDKEKFIAQAKRIIYSIFSAKRTNGIIALLRLTHDKFGNFIIGKVFDSMIIGVLCFILLSIFKIPYCALISVVIGVTNIIPFFGPFIGAVPSSLLVLLADPVKCITFIIIIIVLQQFDGNILGPRILGSSTGVSGFWVMFSILIGSSLFGIWGMICAVPFFAVIYTLARDGCMLSLEKRGMGYTTKQFQKIDHIDEKSGKPVYFDDIPE